jgi:protein-L-isoaspartate O-methyltransferase
MSEDTASQAFFEAKYQQAGDPWDFATNAYEQTRYSAILSSLGDRRFRRAFEPGCSIGVLTERLAGKCGQVEAIEISSTAASQAEKRCRLLSNVNVRQGSLPGDIPSGAFDLILFSEIGYYFQPAVLTSLVTELVRRLDAGGVLLAAHWLGVSVDHQLRGDQVHELLSTIPGLQPRFAQRHSAFRINHWTKL